MWIINLLPSRTVVQAARIAYGQRATLGDPAFTPNVTALERLYLSEPTVEAARARINDSATYPISYYATSGYTPGRESGTSHLAAHDGSAMAVSVTTTVNLVLSLVRRIRSGSLSKRKRLTSYSSDNSDS